MELRSNESNAIGFNMHKSAPSGQQEIRLAAAIKEIDKSREIEREQQEFVE